MALKTVEDALASHSGYNHVAFKVTGVDTFVVLLDNGFVTGAYANNARFDLSTRAGFSTDAAIAQASADVNALNVVLAARQDLLTDWKENYLISTIADLAEVDDDAIEVNATNESLQNFETDLSIEPVDLDTLFNAVEQELNARNEERELLGFTDEEQENIGFELAGDDFTPKNDAQNFVRLACGSQLSIAQTLGYSAGFYLSEIYDAIVDLAKEGLITLAKLTANGYGDKVLIAAMRPEQTDPDQNSLAYLDAERADGQDQAHAEDLLREGQAGDDEEEPVEPTEESQPLEVPELPSFNLDLASADDNAEETEETEEKTEEEPKEEPADDNDQQVENETTYEEEATPTVEDTPSDVISLVNAVSKARDTLADLKAKKQEVDGKIADLPVEEAEEIDKQINSMKEDRTELDEQIEELRQKKADLDEKIADARSHKAELEEELSHRDEYEAESADLKSKIEALAEVL